VPGGTDRPSVPECDSRCRCRRRRRSHSPKILPRPAVLRPSVHRAYARPSDPAACCLLPTRGRPSGAVILRPIPSRPVQAHPTFTHHYSMQPSYAWAAFPLVPTLPWSTR